MKESIPSMAQPPQAAQKLRFWLAVRLVLISVVAIARSLTWHVLRCRSLQSDLKGRWPPVVWPVFLRLACEIPLARPRGRHIKLFRDQPHGGCACSELKISARVMYVIL